MRDDPRGRLALRAGDRARTGDIHLGRVTLYQLSYSRKTDRGRAAMCPTASRTRLPSADSFIVGREGFEPPYSYENRFTVCRL